MQANSIIPADLHVQLVDGQPTVSSTDVARMFEKQHFHVLRDIRKLHEDEPEFSASNFGCIDFIDKNGEKQPAYSMTEQGFYFLALSFTGALARKFKIAYIKEFKRMREENAALQEKLHRKALQDAKSEVFLNTVVTPLMIRQEPRKAAGLTLRAIDNISRYKAITKTDRKKLDKAYDLVAAVDQSMSRW